MLRATIAFMLSAAVLCGTAEAADCDSVLIPQISNLSENSRASLSWLALVDRNNYAQAQQSASAMGVFAGGMFQGNYDNFSARRSRHFSQNSYSSNVEQAREEFKSNFSRDQLEAWVGCMRAANSLIITYDQVDANGAMINVEWKASPLVGPLSHYNFRVESGVVRNPRSPAVLNGMAQYYIRRPSDASSPIRAIASGVSGVNNQRFAASVYVAPIPTAQEIVPERLVVSLNNRVLRSIARWGRGTRQASWECIQADSGFDMVVISTSQRILGRRRGACVGRGSYCNSQGEGCIDIVIASGCLVSTRWHAWYRSRLERERLPYTTAGACVPNSD